MSADILDLSEYETLKLILDEIDALIYVIDIQTHEILYENKKCLDEFGDALHQKCFIALQGGNDMACKGCPLSDENFVKEDNATYKWEHTNSINNKTYLFSDKNFMFNNRPSKIQIGIDITNQKNLESKIKEQQKKNLETFEAFTNSTIEGLIIYDRNKKCYKVNKIAPELFGYEAEEMIGKEAYEFIAEESLDFVKNVIHNQNQEPYEAWMKRKDGSTFPAILRGKDITLNNEKIRVSAVFDITDIKEKEKEISKLAYYDSLTSLPNRALLEDRANQLILTNERSKNYGALMFVDLDHFKTINDTKGHVVGDKILIECAKRLQKITRAYDTVARFGGDEFIVLINTQSTNRLIATEVISIIAKKILIALKMPYKVESSHFQLSASVGIAMFNDKISFSELLKHADSAMYYSKDKGRDNFSFFDPKLQKKIERKAVLLERLRDAVKNNTLEIHYQKQVDKNKKVIGVEALARWNDEVLGTVSPIEFIPIAEESGLIIKFGNYLIEEAAKLLKEWREDKKKKEWRISINISLTQFERDDFIVFMAKTVDRFKIPKNRLRLEITESLLLKNAELALKKIDILKELGISISIDDFGTGYSSLSYLKKLSIDELKIDKSFINEIITDENDETIVTAILSIGKKFGFEIIAEGVENKKIYEKLKSLGCNLYQGYYFAKPAPKSEL